MQFCFDALRGVCATYSDSFPFWQILVSAVITSATIVASVLLAGRAAQREVERSRESDKFDRRSRAIANFAEMCADLLHGSAQGDWDRFRFRKMTYMSRITVDMRAPEEPARIWMQNASSEVIKAIDTSVLPVRFDRAIEVMDERIDDLRGWATFTGTWAEYLTFASVRPVPVRFDESGKLATADDTGEMPVVTQHPTS